MQNSPILILLFYNLKVHSLKKWVASDEGVYQLPTNKLNVLLNELDSHEAALKAGNTFPITYSLISHVSTMVCVSSISPYQKPTYAII